MAIPQLKLAHGPGAAMDTRIQPNWWARRSLGVRIGIIASGLIVLLLILILAFFGTGERTLRVPAAQLTISPVEQGMFRDLIPLRANVVPRNTVYLDAIEGGRVESVLVEAGEMVESGQRMIEFGNTNLQLQVIQQESQLNQAISQLQQNEISLEQTFAANERLLADIDYNIVRLTRSAGRRDALADKGVISAESREAVSDELKYYQHVHPIQAESNRRQAELRMRLLPEIRDQLENLRQNLEVVRSKLDNLIVRAPVGGRITQIDLKIGENRNPGQRLAEITPETGYKLSADVDEFYLSRVRADQIATVELNGQSIRARVDRIYPQVTNGRFRIDLAFVDADPTGLVPGQALQGRLALGEDRQGLVLATGAFLERTGGDWVFVVTGDDTAKRRRIQIGRRNAEQVEIADGLHAGEQVITSDYTGYERLDRIVLTR